MNMKKNCRSNVFGIRKKPVIIGEPELQTAVVMSLQFFGLFVFPEFLLQLYTINLFEWNKKSLQFFKSYRKLALHVSKLDGLAAQSSLQFVHTIGQC